MKLEDLKKLCDEATPGPWEVVGSTIESNATDADVIGLETKGGPGMHYVVLKLEEADARFIVAARAALPKLLESVEAFRAYSTLDNRRWETGESAGNILKDAWDRKEAALAALESK